MPTKTKQNKISPAKAIPPQAIMPLAKGAVGAVAGGMSAGISELDQIKQDFKEQGFKDQKFGKKLGMLAKGGLRAFGAYQQGMYGGLSQGLLGTDFGLSQKGLLADNNPQAAVPVENIAQNSSAGPNPVFNPANADTINSVMGPTDTYGSLFT